MLKLKSLLIESQRSEVLSYEEAKEIYLNKCKGHKPHNQQIYRGIESTEEHLLSNPSEFERKSLGDVGNHYTLMIDNLPSWSDYPKRSRSLIGSMSSDIASSYGNLYVVIPFDGAKVGVAPSDDLWFSFNEGLKEVLGFSSSNLSLSYLNMSLDVLYYFIDKSDGMYFAADSGLIDQSFSDLWNAVQEIDKNIDQIIENMKKYKEDARNVGHKFTLPLEFAKRIKNRNWDLPKRIKKALDPNLNGFELKEYGSAFRTSKRSNEVWTDSDCLLIDSVSYDPFIESVRR